MPPNIPPVPVLEMLIPKGRKNRPGLAMTPLYITWHSTGNRKTGANARNTVNWFHTAAGLEAGVHYIVDDKEIIRILPLDENGWHATDGYNGVGNRQSIAIELCENADADYVKVLSNGAWLGAHLITYVKSLKPFPQCMKMHYQWHPHTACPWLIRTWLHGRTGDGWGAFRQMVESQLLSSGSEEESKPIPDELTILRQLVKNLENENRTLTAKVELLNGKIEDAVKVLTR